MIRDPATVRADLSLGRFMDDVVWSRRFTTYPVVDDGHADPLHLVVEIKGYRGEDAKERYRTQAATYAWAAAEITGRPVREVRFVFLSSRPVETGSFAVGPDFGLQARARIGAAAPPSRSPSA